MANSSIHTSTPLARAILKFFRNLEEAIVKETLKPGSVKAYLFGGCALHIHTMARGSNDIDVEINAAKWLTGKDIKIKKSVTYSDGQIDRILTMDSNFTPMLGPLHEDYEDDAIRLQKNTNDSPLWVYVITPEDLAVSKLGRYGHQDREDILTLLKLGKMTVDSFYERAKEALKYYVGNVSGATTSLEQVIKMYNQRYG